MSTAAGGDGPCATRRPRDGRGRAAEEVPLRQLGRRRASAPWTSRRRRSSCGWTARRRRRRRPDPRGGRGHPTTTAAPQPPGADGRDGGGHRVTEAAAPDRTVGGARDAVRRAGDDVQGATPLFRCHRAAPSRASWPAWAWRPGRLPTCAGVLSTGTSWSRRRAARPGQIRRATGRYRRRGQAGCTDDLGPVRDDEATEGWPTPVGATPCHVGREHGRLRHRVKAVLGRPATMLDAIIRPGCRSCSACSAGRTAQCRVRSARQPGLLAGQLRAARPAGPAPDVGHQQLIGPAPASRRGLPPPSRRQTHWNRSSAGFGDPGAPVRSTGGQGSHRWPPRRGQRWPRCRTVMASPWWRRRRVVP